jgi:hypothetical protein
MATEKIVVVESARSARAKIVVVGFGIVRRPVRKSSSSKRSAPRDWASRSRSAQRRAMAVMSRYMWRKVRLRARQESELVASLTSWLRARLGSRPQRRMACRAMTQRSRRSQPACQAVIQTMPSGLGGLVACFGRKRRTAMARTPSARCSLRQAETSQMSQSGVRVRPFMAGSIGEV